MYPFDTDQRSGEELGRHSSVLRATMLVGSVPTHRKRKRTLRERNLWASCLDTGLVLN